MTGKTAEQKTYKIFLTGADPYQWALDEDMKQTEMSVSDFTEFVSAKNADIIHSVYWESLLKLPEDILKSKKVICNLSGEWGRYTKDFGKRFKSLLPYVDVWVVRSKKALKEIEAKKETAFLIPYTVNTDVFFPCTKKEKAEWRKKYKISNKTYLIGNFMRDSNAGKLKTPKEVKGPDIFLEIVKDVYAEKKDILVLLAGPRRHWLRSQLKANGIPYKFIGLSVPFEDMRINTLNRAKLNRLYNILDLTVTSSRSEAGPHAILEAGAAKCPQISTAVGIAPDILSKKAIYKSVKDAAVLIKKDIEKGHIANTAESVYTTVVDTHTAKHVQVLYETLYKKVLSQ